MADEETREIQSASTDEPLSFQRTEYFILYKRRFFVLAVLSLALFLNGEAWMTFGSVTQQSIKYLNATGDQVILFSTIFLIAYSIAAIPCIIMPQFIGSRLTFIIGCSLNLSGALLRVLVTFVPPESKFRLSTALFGNCCFGFSMAFLFSLPTLISSIWFGGAERSLSTSIPFMSNCFGVGFGYLVIFLAMQQTNDITHIENAFFYVFLFETIACFVCLVSCLIFLREQPSTPPSQPEKERIRNSKGGSFTYMINHTFSLAISIWTKEGAVAALIVYMFNYGTYMIIFTYLADIVDNFVVVQTSVTGYIGAVGVIFGGFFTLLAGYLMEKTMNDHNNKIGIFANILSGFPLFVLLLLCWMNKLNNVTATIFFIWFLSFCPTYMTIGAEILAEITFPIDPNIASSEALILGNAFGAIASNLFTLIAGDARYIVVMSLCIVLYIFNTFLLNRKFIRTRSSNN